MANEGERSVLKYIALFAVSYFVLRLAIDLFVSLTHAYYYSILLTTGPSASLAAYRYLEDNKRLYSNKEKAKLILASFLCLLITNVIYMPREKMMFGDSNGFVLLQLLHLFFLWTIFGPVAKSVYQRRQQSS